MLRRCIAILTLALGPLLVCVAAQESAPDEVIKVKTTLVSVPVIVSDRDGRYIPGLTAADFSIYQDGTEQRADFFAATEEPLIIALLIDTSHSTEPVLGDIKDSAKSFVKLLNPKDRATIVAFDYDTHVLCPLTSDHDELNKAIRSAEIPRPFGTTLRDATYDTVTKTFAGLNGRKAIILLTDGKDFGSSVSARQLLYSMQESDTLIYTIFFETGERPRRQRFDFPDDRRRGGSVFGRGYPGDRFPGGRRGGRDFPRPRDDTRRRERVEAQNEKAEAFLNELSDMTAGRFYASKNGKLKKTFGLIVDELRFQYRLGFYPAENAAERTLHEIKVKVARPNLVVRARPGYRLPANQGLP